MKTKHSVTIDQDRLDEAQRLTGDRNVSAVVGRALDALITAERERVHLEGYLRMPQGGETVSDVDSVVWAGLPWDEE